MGAITAEPDELDDAATEISTFHDDLAALRHPIASNARKFGVASEVPELEAALRRFAAAASTMTHEVSLHVKATRLMTTNVAATARKMGQG